ncbi:MAG: hypothetical protein Q8909_18765, partial [Bacteroidota bacterium]|nr:hypothetical protein [Bacteroidota bacterium]
METMVNLLIEKFDYIFYRICDYYKKKKDSGAETAASSIMSLIQCFVVLDLLIIIRIAWEYPIPENFNKYWVLLVFVPVAILNWKRYEKSRRYREYRLKWKDEEPNSRKHNGILLVLFIIGLILIPILYGII